MLVRTIPIALSTALLALACGKGNGNKSTDPAPAPVPVDDPVPADAPQLGIDQVDDFRWVLSEPALLELAVGAASGSIEYVASATGLELQAFPAGGVLHQSGFRRGDVIVAIDGAPPADLAESYRRARSTGTVDVELTRGTERLTRTYYLIDERQLVRTVDGIVPDPIVTALVEAMETGIKQTRADRFELSYDIDALVVKALADNPGILDQAMGGAGELTRRIGGKTVMTALGITPYDALQSLDQHPVRSARALSRALSELGPARSFSLSIIRVTTPLVIRFRVVDELVMDAQLAGAIANWNKANQATEPDDDVVLRRRHNLDPDDPDDPNAPDFSAVEKIDDDHYAMPAVLLTMMDGGGRRAARFVPSVKNGVLNGVKVYAVRPSSLMAHAGIRNGDTIHSIGGTDIGSEDELRAAFQAASHRSSVVLEITRRGRAVTVTYDLR